MAPRAEVCGLGRTEEDIKKPRSLLDVGTLTRDTLARDHDPAACFRRTRPTAARARARPSPTPNPVSLSARPATQRADASPLPTTSEPDWAKPRRVAFCVGDDAAAVADAWAWTAARFLEPTDDVIMLRVWCPDAAAFRSDVDPDYAAEVDFHQERTTTSWLPPPCATVSRAARRPSPAATPTSSSATSTRTSPPRVRLPDTARATPWTSSSSARDPVAAPSLRALLGTVSDAVVRNSPCPCLVLRRGGSACVAGVEIASGPGAVPSADSGSTSPGSPGPPTRSRGSRGSFARNFRASHARNSRASHAPARGHRRGRLGRVLSRGSMVSRRVTPPDGRGDPRARRVGVSEHAFSRVYAERGVASRPVGGDDAHAAAATRDAWRALERALERAGTTPPYRASETDKDDLRVVPGRLSWARTRRVWLERFRRARLGVDWTNFWPSWRRNRGRIDAGGLRGAPRRWGRRGTERFAPRKTPTRI